LPDLPILVQLVMAEHQRLGLAAGPEACALESEKSAIAREHEQEPFLGHAEMDRWIGAVEQVTMGELVEADDKVKTLQRRRPAERRGELLLHAVIRALPHRQHGDRQVIGEVTGIFVRGEDDDVMPALTNLPGDFDAIALEAASWEKLHDRESDTHARGPT